MTVYGRMLTLGIYPPTSAIGTKWYSTFCGATAKKRALPAFDKRRGNSGKLALFTQLKMDWCVARCQMWTSLRARDKGNIIAKGNSFRG